MWSAAHDAHCNAHSQSLGWKQARRRNDLPDPLSNPISSPIDLAALNALVPEKSKVALAAASKFTRCVGMAACFHLLGVVRWPVLCENVPSGRSDNLR